MCGTEYSQTPNQAYITDNMIDYKMMDYNVKLFSFHSPTLQDLFV